VFMIMQHAVTSLPKSVCARCRGPEICARCRDLYHLLIYNSNIALLARLENQYYSKKVV